MKVMLRRGGFLLLLVLLAAAGAACTRAAAMPPEVKPPLDVPPVPPRIIEPLPSTEPASIEKVPDLAPDPEPATRKPAPRETPKPEPPKQEAKPEPPPDPATTSPPTPVPPLRTPNSAEGPAATQQVRDTQERAKKLLHSINAAALSNDRLANYNSAKQYLQQSEEALKSGNVSQAQALASRAENIATLLINR